MRTALSAFFVVAVAAAVSYGVFVYEPATAQDADAQTPRVISVSGMGEASAAPDQARISLGVTTEARNARDALRANSQAMQAIFDQMEELGIPEENIQTSNLSINPQYPPYNQNNPQPRRITGYQVSNTVSVLFEDLDAFGAGLDAIVSSGANELHGISFSISETDEMMTAARTSAVEDARARAETLAAAAGVTLGDVLSISEGGGYSPQPVYARMAMNESASFDVPVAAGEQTLSVSVNMVFEIQ